MLATWQNPLAPFATRYTPHAIEPEESFVMLGAGSPVSNFHNRRCAPLGLSPAELKAELIERTGAPGIHPRFGELARMACTSTAYVHTVCKSQAITQPWASQPVTLLGDAVFNMSNTLSRGANCAVFDAAALAECLTSPADEGRSPAGMDAYVRENIERRLNERQRSFLMQNIVFPGRGSLGAFVRDMTLARALRRIDALDRGEDGAGEVGVGHEGSSNPKGEEGCVSPRWVEELRWEELFAMRHAEGKEGTQ
jgi:2-polyprenyl-6-methoxyphenol hydroxylase-like FAD-dependent oxidoreductase